MTVDHSIQLVTHENAFIIPNPVGFLIREIGDVLVSTLDLPSRS